jgi:subtilisin family serine protease
MRKELRMRIIRVGVLSVVLVLALTAASFADNDFKQPRRPHAVLYEVRPDATAAELGVLNAILHSRSVRIEKKIRNLGINLGSYADTSVSEDELCKELMATHAVKYAEPDYLVTPVIIPDDPYYGSQWQLAGIGAPEAWETTTGSYSILVAVCDTGISSGHPDLADNLQLPGYNAVDGSTDTEPVYNHGTGVAGCIGATGNNALGVTGVAWDVAILPIRITNTPDGLAYVSDAAEGIRYAADQGAKVVNLSYLMANYSTIDSAAQYLRGKGGLLFVAQEMTDRIRDGRTSVRSLPSGQPPHRIQRQVGQTTEHI